MCAFAKSAASGTSFTDTRASGVLLHMTSLPSSFGIGDLGSEAYRFVDWLAGAGQSYWQVLPVQPTDLIMGNSPYSSSSCFAGNTLLISPELLVEEGWVDKKDVPSQKTILNGKISYGHVLEWKSKLFDCAYATFVSNKAAAQGFQSFCRENKDWLEDYALFVVIKEQMGGKDWGSWPESLRFRENKTMMRIRKEEKIKLERIYFLQYLFFHQWDSLRAYCAQKNVRLIGDVPIYVSYDSADVWANRSYFKLKKSGKPQAVAGVPPDYFSRTGQRWGNPLYDWKRLRDEDYRWWVRRLEHQFRLFDVLRLDHFRAFASFWQIPPDELTAEKGKWVKGPGQQFFKTLLKKIPSFPVIAEDLGIITEDVTALKDAFGFPGMKVLMFAFGGDFRQNPFLPDNFKEPCVAYPGTHDNNTVQGWVHRDATDEEKEHLKSYLGGTIPKDHLAWRFIEILMYSRASLVILPMQDLLGLDERARMNLPATCHGNWEWRVSKAELSSALRRDLLELTRKTQRLAFQEVCQEFCYEKQ